MGGEGRLGDDPAKLRALRPHYSCREAGYEKAQGRPEEIRGSRREESLQFDSRKCQDSTVDYR